MNFSDRVKKYFESRLIYESLHEEIPDIYLLFTLCNECAVSTTLVQGKENLEDLKGGVLHEYTDYNTREVTIYENYVRTGKMKYDMRDLAKDGIYIGDLLYKMFKSVWNLTTSELYDIIDKKTLALIGTIKEIDRVTQEADPAIFEANFFKLMNRYDWTETEREYQREKNWHCVTMEWLQEKQEQALQRVLEMNIMQYVGDPSTQYLEKVDYPYHRGFLSCDFKDNVDYTKAYAKFMHYATRKENLIIPDYKNYGKYIALNLYKFRPEQKKALFELIYILNLIHKDMVELKPELAKYLGMKSDESIEGSRYFAIYINMVEMFKKDWFVKYRSDKKYNLGWINQFFDDLLRSEWRDEIADEWYKPDKVLSVQGHIIGCLIKAGVINGSDLSVASAIIKGTDRENKTFATYMGRGKRESYCNWICKYTNP